jgi:hypothetical protein
LWEEIKFWLAGWLGEEGCGEPREHYHYPDEAA